MEASFLAAALCLKRRHIPFPILGHRKSAALNVFRLLWKSVSPVFTSCLIHLANAHHCLYSASFISVLCHSHCPPVTRRPQSRFFFFILFHQPNVLLLLNLTWAHFFTLVPSSLYLCLIITRLLFRGVPHPLPKTPSYSPFWLPFSNHAPRPRQSGAHAQSTPLPGRSGVGGVGEGGGGAGVGSYLGGGALTMWQEGEKVH